MTGERLTGKMLREKWNLEKQTRKPFKKSSKIYVDVNGYQYTKMSEAKNFPAIYCDEHGFRVFETHSEYKEFLSKTGNSGTKKKTVTLKERLSNVEGYQKISEDTH